MQDEQSRNAVVDDLKLEKKEISGNIKRSPAQHTDVDSIVRTCADYDGGIEALLKIVRHHESGSTASERLDEVTLEIQSPIQFSEPLLDELRQHVNTLAVPLDQLQKMYRASLPIGKITTGLLEPRTAYQFVLNLLQFDEPCYALVFVEYLAKNQPDKNLEQVLQQWIDKAVEEMGTTREQILSMRQQDTAAASSYLMILLRPASPKTFTLQAWLWKSPDEIATLHAEDKPCSLARIEKIVQDIVTDVGGPDVTVELFVPRQLFTEDLTRWKMRIGMNAVPIVDHNPVVLRWLNRNADPKSWKLWERKWQEVREASHLNDDALVCFPREEGHDTPRRLLADLTPPHRGICIALGFIPPSTVERADDLLTTILYAGTPIVLWFQEPLEDQTKPYTKKLLGNHKLQSLPQLAWELSNQAARAGQEQHYNCLTVLYDDAERLPPVLSLSAPARR
jgi:hypothetical protein